MKINIGPEIVRTYKNLSYDNWHALAEFVDNSTESYKKYRDSLSENLIIDISLKKVKRLDNNESEDCLVIRDNAAGMDKSELGEALYLGKPPEDKTYRSQFGLGMKTAACWFSDYWEVSTSKVDAPETLSVRFDVEKVAGHDLVPHFKRELSGIEEHFTEIRLFNLHRGFAPKTIGKVREYLSQMYRKDLDEGIVKLNCLGGQLSFSYEDDLFKRCDFPEPYGKGRFVRKASTKINGKYVEGWMGVFYEARRPLAGITLMKGNRCIVAPPHTYRPDILYGENSNTLINQRLVGEFQMDNFEVSHIKNEVLFTEDDDLEFQNWLLEKFGDMKAYASEFRVKDYPQIEYDDVEVFEESIRESLQSIHRAELQDKIDVLEIPSENIISQINGSIARRTIDRNKPNFTVEFRRFKVHVYFNFELSINDPYVISEVVPINDEINIIVNGSHPYFTYVNDNTTLGPEFIRQAVYDGISEWKATLIKRLTYNSVKKIKDELLRIDYGLSE